MGEELYIRVSAVDSRKKKGNEAIGSAYDNQLGNMTTEDNTDKFIVRRYPKDTVFENTYRDLINRIMDSQSDIYNPPLNETEIQVAGRIRNYFNEVSLNADNKIQLFSHKSSPDSYVELNLEERVSVKGPEIITRETITNENGVQTPYDMLGLVVSMFYGFGGSAKASETYGK